MQGQAGETDQGDIEGLGGEVGIKVAPYVFQVEVPNHL